MTSINQKTIDRNLHEVTQALSEHKLLSEIENYNNQHGIYGLNFFTVAYFATFNSMMGRAAKVLDRHPDSHGFWLIYKKNKNAIEQSKCFSSEKIPHLEDISNKLKHIRDTTLFHIDKEAIIDSKKVWADAAINAKSFKVGLDFLHEILYELCDDAFKYKYRQFFDGQGIAQLLKFAAEHSLI